MQLDNDDITLKSVASLFKLLSNSDRIRIAGLLRHGEMDVTRLYRAMRVSQSVVSQHMKLFKLHGLVNERKVGSHVYYSLKGTLLNDLVSVVIKARIKDLSGTARDAGGVLGEMPKNWESRTEAGG